MKLGLKKLFVGVALTAIAFGAYAKMRPSIFDTGEPLLATGAPIDFLASLDPDTLTLGWAHRSFFRVDPTDYHIEYENENRLLRCTTNNSGSILARDTEILVSEYPQLSWRWKVTEPIESDIDEALKEGDDHPLRLYLQFSNEDGTKTGTEIIWSNKKFAAGDYKVIGSFYHYVANGLNENLRVWHDQNVDLNQLYEDIGGTGVATLETFGFFCDSDNTGSRSDGFFSDVILHNAPT